MTETNLQPNESHDIQESDFRLSALEINWAIFAANHGTDWFDFAGRRRFWTRILVTNCVLAAIVIGLNIYSQVVYGHWVFPWWLVVATEAGVIFLVPIPVLPPTIEPYRKFAAEKALYNQIEEDLEALLK